jgi:hypothetical protein
MSPLDSFWNGVLSLLTPIITPDWGKLVVLIPWLLLLLVLGFLTRLLMAWVGLYRGLPVRGPKVRRRPLRPLLIVHVAVMALGIIVVATGFIVGSHDPNWQSGSSPVGLVVNLPLLIAGLVIVISAAGSGARMWDRDDAGDDLEPDAIDHLVGIVRRHPGRVRRAIAFALGVLLAGVGLALGTAPGRSDQPLPAAVVPLLLLGLALAVGAVGATIAAMWRSDSDFDGPESNGMVTTEH